MSIRRFSRLESTDFCTVLLAISAFLGGCATLSPPQEAQEPPSEAAPTIATGIPSELAEIPAPPPPLVYSVADTNPAPPLPAPPPPPEPERVVILISDDLPVFVSAADQIKRQLGDQPFTVHNLDGDLANSENIVEELNESKPDRLIAVGLLAAQMGTMFDDVPMVFCYVFNYEEHSLLSTTSNGVNLLPPFEMQLEAWKTLAPDLDRVGVIVGPTQAALVDEIQHAADGKEVELLTRIVNSDQEALYSFQRITPEIQGLWLVPDNRILSPRVVGEIMSYARDHQIQIVVFGRGMLEMGALMAVTTIEEDVATQDVARLDQVNAEGQFAAPAMAPLTQMNLDINPDVARELGLVESEQSARLERIQ